MDVVTAMAEALRRGEAGVDLEDQVEVLFSLLAPFS